MKNSFNYGFRNSLDHRERETRGKAHQLFRKKKKKKIHSVFFFFWNKAVRKIVTAGPAALPALVLALLNKVRSFQFG